MKSLHLALLAFIALLTVNLTVAVSPVYADHTAAHTAAQAEEEADAASRDLCATDKTSQELKKTEGLDLGYCEIKNALPKSNIESIGAFIATILSWVSWVVGVLAFLGLIVTGIMYITAGGNAEQAEKAQKNIVWIVTGIVIFMFSLWVPRVIRQFIAEVPNNPKLLVGEPPAGSTDDTLGFRTELTQVGTLTLDTTPVTKQRVLGTTEQVTVSISNGIVTPTKLAIRQGTAVVWINQDDAGHGFVPHPTQPSSIGGGKFYLPPRTTLAQFYAKPGEFNYAKVDDKGKVLMSGRITVEADTRLSTPDCSTTTLAEKQITAIVSLAGIHPASIPINQGTTITWENRDTKVHTITIDPAMATLAGPKPTKLEPGKSLTHTFSSNYGQFVYLDEADGNPLARYIVCVYPPEQ